MTGALQPISRTPESSPAVVVHPAFAVPIGSPLKTGKRLADVIDKFERKPAMRAQLQAARKQMVAGVREPTTFRMLRLGAGLSQRALADKAGDGTTQSYIARIEAGSLDPSTDLIQRLAAALSVAPAVVFEAILKQRAGGVTRA
jgi:DNA-binding XRE family transcriptional regulator